MKSKAPLQVMEQIVMIAVFAIAAAMCLEAYLVSYRTSRTDELAESAMSVADSMIECFRAGAGCPLEGPEYGEPFSGTFSEAWAPDEDGIYEVSVSWDFPDDRPLARLEIRIASPDGRITYLERKATLQA